MPRDTSGDYVLPVSTFYPAQLDTDIDPNDANALHEDVAAALNDVAAEDLSNVNWSTVPTATLQAIYNAMVAAGVIVAASATNLSAVNWSQVSQSSIQQLIQVAAGYGYVLTPEAG